MLSGARDVFLVLQWYVLFLYVSSRFGAENLLQFLTSGWFLKDNLIKLVYRKEKCQYLYILITERSKQKIAVKQEYLRYTCFCQNHCVFFVIYKWITEETWHFSKIFILLLLEMKYFGYFCITKSNSNQNKSNIVYFKFHFFSFFFHFFSFLNYF